jgi:hypothetical protein
MRILAITNLYPPHHIGGYELACQEAVEAFKTRGHHIKVLTSTYGADSPRSEGEVYRWLTCNFDKTIDWQTGVLKETANQAALRQICTSFEPEVVFIWNMSYISISLAALADTMGYPTCYYVFDNWLATFFPVF